jgi:hypothetical protein
MPLVSFFPLSKFIQYLTIKFAYNHLGSDTETTVSNTTQAYTPHIDETSQNTLPSNTGATPSVVKTENTPPSSHHAVNSSIKFDPTSVAQFGVLNLFINHVPLDMNDAELLSLFSPFGDIDSAKVMVDLQTGQSKGYGFVKVYF